MIGLNEELAQRQAEGKPVRIGLIGAGQMGTDVIAETSMMKGIEVVATADIDLQRAVDGYRTGQVSGEVVVVADKFAVRITELMSANGTKGSQGGA